MGTAFFAATPLATIFSANFVNESSAQMTQTMIITVAQICVYLFLMNMLTSKKSKYHAATFRN